MTARDAGQRWTLTVEAVGGAAWADTPPVLRLRRVLKSLHRGYGLRVVAVHDTLETPDEGSDGRDRT